MSSNAPRRAPENPLYGCIHIPDYPVQAFVRNEPELRRHPVAVLDGTFPLFTVVATNIFARRAGVEIGMTKLQLEQFEGIEVRYRSQRQEECTHQSLLDCAHRFTPRVEDTALDTITLDLNGLSGLWGDPRTIAQKLLWAADKLGLEAHIATASNPDAAIHQSKTESGITVIPAGEEETKLRSLSLDILSPSEEIGETFRQWGLQTFEDLTKLPRVNVAERLGQEGVRLQQMARGETTRPLRISKRKLSFKESMELEHSIDSLESLTFILSRLLNQLCERLTARNQTTRALHLSLSLESLKKEWGRNESDVVFHRTIHLPIPIRDPKILLKLLQLDLETHCPPAPIIGILLRAEPVDPRRIQNGLFTPPVPEPEKLELTLARVSAIVGQGNVGSLELSDTHRPDAFRIKRFNIPHGPSATQKNCSQSRRTHAECSAGTALRVFRPPQPVTVDLDQGQPSKILFAGKSGKVVRAVGPWNTSGEWWREDSWSREEWDVEVQTGWKRILYRIYRDPRRDCWFVNGSYD